MSAVTGAARLDLGALYKRLDARRRVLAHLDATQGRYIDEKADLIEALSSAQAYLDIKDDIALVLAEAQSTVQARSKALFEELLTQLVHDVMPDNEDRIHIETGVRRNRSTLDFLSRSATGFFESIHADKGGAIQNIISTGLRFIVLSRTRNRRILLLDEPDCWMRAQYIPVFMKIIEGLARRVGVQVLYISHHSTRHAGLTGQRIHLHREGGVVVSETQSAQETPAPESRGIGDENHLNTLMEGVGWRYIRLVNIKSHDNTLIELCPTMNYLSGDNDIGKSHVIRAIEAMLTNAGSDMLIQHGKNEAMLEIGLEEGMTLVWRYRRTGTRKTTYELLDDQGQLVQESRSGTDVPDWLHEYLAMAPVNGLNVHVGGQQETNFLIDRATSAHQRAEALSLGSDAQRIQRMVTLHGERCSRYRRDLNECQQKLRRVKNQLAIFRHNAGIEERLEQASDVLDAAHRGGESLQALARVATRLGTLSGRARALERVARHTSAVKPELRDTGSLARLIDRLEGLEARAQALKPIATVHPPQEPKVMPLAPLVDVAGRISRAGARQRILADALKKAERRPDKPPALNDVRDLQAKATRIKHLSTLRDAREAVRHAYPDEHHFPGLPLMRDTRALASRAERLVTLGRNVEHQARTLSDHEAELKRIEADTHALIRKTGYCPVCRAQHAPDMNTTSCEGGHT